MPFGRRDQETGLPGRGLAERGREVVRWWSCHAAAAVAEVRELGVQVQTGETQLGRHRCVLLLNVAFRLNGFGWRLRDVCSDCSGKLLVMILMSFEEGSHEK